MDFRFDPKKLVCKRCGLEIPDNHGTTDREWKPGKARLACENCARKVPLKKLGRQNLRGEQEKFQAPHIKVE